MRIGYNYNVETCRLIQVRQLCRPAASKPICGLVANSTSVSEDLSRLRVGLDRNVPSLRNTSRKLKKGQMAFQFQTRVGPHQVVRVSLDYRHGTAPCLGNIEGQHGHQHSQRYQNFRDEREGSNILEVSQDFHAHVPDGHEDQVENEEANDDGSDDGKFLQVFVDFGAEEFPVDLGEMACVDE